MAKNMVQMDGDHITIPSPGSIASGDVVIAGDLLGVALNSAESGEDLVLKTEGVAELAKDGVAKSVGDSVDWDGSQLVAAAGGNRAGIIVEAAGAGDAVAKVKLNAPAA